MYIVINFSRAQQYITHKANKDAQTLVKINFMIFFFVSVIDFTLFQRAITRAIFQLKSAVVTRCSERCRCGKVKL